KKVIKIFWMLADRCGKGSAACHFVFDLQHEVAHARVLQAFSDNIEALHERYAGLHHCRQLSCEYRDIRWLDRLLAGKERLGFAFDRFRSDTLLAKLCLYYCLTGANSFTLGGSSLAIRALPCVDLRFSGNCCHLLILCHPVYFFEAGNTCGTLHQRRGSQTVESLGTSRFIDHYRVAF